MEFVAEEPSRQRAYDIPKKYTPELLAKAQSHLDAAAKQTSRCRREISPPSRLRPLRDSITRSSSLTPARACRSSRPARAQMQNPRPEVLANWQRVETMKQEFPPFAINWQAVFRVPVPGRKAKRVMGLHPDTPLSGRVLRELRAAGRSSRHLFTRSLAECRTVGQTLLSVGCAVTDRNVRPTRRSINLCVGA